MLRASYYIYRAMVCFVLPLSMLFSQSHESFSQVASKQCKVVLVLIRKKKNNAKKIVQYFISQVVTLSKEKDQFRLSIYQEKI